MLLTKLTLILVVCSLVGLVEAGNASEQWDAKTTARVNLRKHPRSGGVILSIVPEGQKLRIMEQDGIWYKVDVEGKIHGKGWVHGDYVEKMTPMTANRGSASEGLTPESAAKDHRKVTQTPEKLPAVRAIEKTVKPPENSLAGIPAITGADEQISGRKTPHETKAEVGPLSKAEVPATDGPARLDPVKAKLDTQKQIETANKSDTGSSEDIPATAQKKLASVPHELPQKKEDTGASPKLVTPVVADPLPLVSTKTPAESPLEKKRPEPQIMSSPAKTSKPAPEDPAPVPDKLQDANIEPAILDRPETPLAGKPGLTPPDALPQTASKQNPDEIGGKDSAKSIEVDVAALALERFLDAEMKNGTVKQETPVPVEEKAATETPRPVSQAETMTTPLKSREAATKTESTGPVRIALKLLSIILSCSVILLLYLENKGIV